MGSQLQNGNVTEKMYLNKGRAGNGSSTNPELSSVSRPIDITKLPYRNCKTRIVDLTCIPNIPRAKNTPDSTYREIYHDYFRFVKDQATRHCDDGTTKQRSQNAVDNVHQLSCAISSLTTGIAPPVAFPTETVYGLGADATNSASIAGIFAAKGRPGDNPLIVHCSSIAHLERCLGGTDSGSAIPKVYQELLQEFWPGPLTVLIPVPKGGRGVKFAPNVHPGQQTIGFRVPESPYARFLIACADRPIAAPSANSSGKPSPTTAQHVKDDLDGKVNFILDGGSCTVGVESTVVDGLCDPPLILRPGGLSKGDLRRWGQSKGNVWASVQNGWERKKITKRKIEELEGLNRQEREKRMPCVAERTESTGNVFDSPVAQTPKNEHSDLDMEGDISMAPRAPGMKYKHYAPSGCMLLFENSLPAKTQASLDSMYNKLGGLLNRQDSEHLHVGILASTSWPSLGDLVDKWQVQYPMWSCTDVIQSVLSNQDLPVSECRLKIDHSKQDSTVREIKIYGISVGTNSSSVAKNLFAALRSCDSLGCEWILAEAPSQHAQGGVRESLQNDLNSTNADEDDEFETVLERMRKAASEVVRT